MAEDPDAAAAGAEGFGGDAAGAGTSARAWPDNASRRTTVLVRIRIAVEDGSISWGSL
jgi:hypothetical protein